MCIGVWPSAVVVVGVGLGGHWCHDGGSISMTAKVTLKVLQSMDLVPVWRRIDGVEGAGGAAPAELLLPAEVIW